MVVGLFNGIAICDKCKRIYCIKYQINIIVDPILLHWHTYVTWLVTQKRRYKASTVDVVLAKIKEERY